MKVEISEESIDEIVVQELTQSLEWARKDLACYDEGINANTHAYNDPETDKEELRKDIESYERILGYWKVQE
jgi:hypothetical protein